MFFLVYWLRVSVNIIIIYIFIDYLFVKRRGNCYICLGIFVFSIYLGKDE